MSADQPPTDPDLATIVALGERYTAAWRRGPRPRIEDYLPADAAVRRAVLPELVKIDLRERLAARDHATLDDYLVPERFPELANDPDRLALLRQTEIHLRARNGVLHGSTVSFDTPPMERPALPEEFGRFRDVRLLAAGRTAAVYLAFDTALERTIVLRVPRYQVGEPGVADRFMKEGRAAAHVLHPNLVQVLEAGFIEDVPFVAQAHVSGRPLTVAYPPPLSPRQAVELVRRLALGLAEAHRHGVVHGDLKPASILVDARGEPVLIGFGPAPCPDEDDDAVAPYTPPELAAGAPVGIGADVYALGVILYELLTGRPPFTGSVRDVLAQVRDRPPPSPRQFRPDLGPRLDMVCLEALAKRPADRYLSMTAFATALANWLDRDAGLVTTADSILTEPPSSELMTTALELLRTWGWEHGLARLKARSASQPAVALLAGWLGGDPAAPGVPLAALCPGLVGWALAGRGYLALRDRHLRALRRLLDEAADFDAGNDAPLWATLAHLRGSASLLEGHPAAALPDLYSALELLGPGHPSTGPVLDTLGQAAAARGDFHSAFALLTQALRGKRHHGDEPGVAQTHDQLGRLLLDWGRPDEADQHFCAGLALARRAGNARSTARLLDHRGQVLLAQGKIGEAAALLDESIRAAAGRWPTVEAFARKDRALAHRAAGELDAAKAACTRAVELFETAGRSRGVAHALRVRGLVRRDQGRPDDSADSLTAAAEHFDRAGAHADAARTRLELARTLRAAGASVPRVAAALTAALDSAARARRDDLAAELERRLHNLAPRELLARLDRRFGEASDGRCETAVVLAVELRVDPEDEPPVALLAACNHLFADLEGPWEIEGLTVLARCGDSLIGLTRGPGATLRAAAAALAAVRAAAEADRPRRVLGWSRRQFAVGLAMGPIAWGRAGLTRPAEAVVVGPAVRQAVALRAIARPGQVLADGEVRLHLGDAFVLAPVAALAGAWEVQRPAE